MTYQKDDGLKDERVIIPMSTSLLSRIDDYRFTQRISSRAEAVRMLVKFALDAQAKTSK